MKLIITRHGETIENKAGILQGHLPGQLSAEGIGQAKALGKRLQSEKIDVIYASDLQRVVDTTREITSYHPDTEVIFTKELRERDLGEFQGQNKHEMTAMENLANTSLNIFEIDQNGNYEILCYNSVKHLE